MTAPVYTANGKQLLRGGEHFADVHSPDAAAVLADVLNRGRMFFPNDTLERVAEIERELWG